MNQERLTTFEDAILAIIMTILVLDLKLPETPTLAGLWQLHASFFAYTLSFFWIGLMWVSHHNNWRHVKTINGTTVMLTLVLLFFTSLFPYTTSFVSENFNNSVAQAFYGLIIIIISLCNVALSRNLDHINAAAHFGLLYRTADWVVYADLGLKIIGLILAITVYPPAMMIAIFLASTLLLVGINTHDK
ncbi:TMEM175 family protein [Lacticaseibacillus saniviri]|uniref:Integral membrane protein n=2 Tax=Lacticaseibacillus saniviri TaxID=931533 RepID=A0A0R2N222_9LACO|nr:TMEM175 family protein [Lacticaseibacillus saniviri]KRO18432.1 hypothetical protein IV56_GL001566 [Lacticaseibacillus saniviri JCM 17471 = DSM 24301]